MWNLKELSTYLSIYLLSMLILMVLLTPFAFASTIDPDIYDQWNTIEEFEEVSSLRQFLLERYWVSEDVSLDELDYILVLTRQCSEEFFPSVPTSLVLSIISIESGFKRDLIGSNNDTGLMQIIPKFHKDRISEYIYEENVDLTDPRLNVMVGMGYLEELMEWSRGGLDLAIMAYNMGPEKAQKLSNNLIVTSYAEEVMARMEDIETFLERGCRYCLS